MEISTITSVIVQYDNLITRYARFFTKNQAAAAKIAMQVMERYYEQEKDLHKKELRKWLQQQVKILCNQWLHSNVVRFFQQTRSAS